MLFGLFAGGGVMEFVNLQTRGICQQYLTCIMNSVMRIVVVEHNTAKINVFLTQSLNFSVGYATNPMPSNSSMNLHLLPPLTWKGKTIEPLMQSKQLFYTPQSHASVLKPNWKSKVMECLYGSITTCCHNG